MLVTTLSRRCSPVARRRQFRSHIGIVASAAASPVAMSQVISMKDRARAAVLGAFLADAATGGLHWIYDQDKLKGLVQSNAKADAPEFFAPPSCPYYQLEVGDLSCYGHEVYPVLKYAASCDSVKGQELAEVLYKAYKAYTGYLNRSVKSLIARIEAGDKFPECGDPEDAQANAFVKLPPIVAHYAGKPELVAAVDATVRVQQNNNASAIAGLLAAKLLEKVILGSSIADALQWLSCEPSLQPHGAELAAVVESVKGKPLKDITSQLGPSCGLPHSLQVAVAGALVSSDYVSGVRANMMAGGDNCSRSVLLGALLAAQYGIDGVVGDWGPKMKQFAEVQALTEQLLANV